jgi:drug/metabolite transporter (DMT)-like permease
MDSLSERRKAILFLVLAAILWSTSGVLVKTMNWGAMAILGGRSLFASLVFLVYLRRIPTQWTRWMVLAAVACVLTQFLFITSTKLTTAANAIFLQYTAPIYVVLLGYWFLREKPSRTDWLSMFIIFLGMFLFFGDKLSTNGLYGNILAVLSGITSAIMIVSFRAQKDGAPAESFLIASLVTAIFCFPFVLKETWTVTNWLTIAYLGLFQLGLAFVFFTKAIKHVPALEANLVGTLEPILNPVWVFLFLGERTGTYALLGGLVVLGGVILSAAGSARAANDKTSKVFETSEV